jgi:YD repeat-containing protein
MIVMEVQQAPVRNASVWGAQVYTHSGEFAPQVLDLDLPARGLSFYFLRVYRSALNQTMGPLGRGWTFSFARRFERDGSSLRYQDGFGRSYAFAASATSGSYISPPGIYAILEDEDGHLVLRERFGQVSVFEQPEDGGRLLRIKDRNTNSLWFRHTDSRTVVTDPLGREIHLLLDQGRVVEVRDHTDRSWTYTYDADGCLVEVSQPVIDPQSGRPRVRYEYDRDFRLISITDPNGQTFLRNTYDDNDRIVHQRHGAGAFTFEYDLLQSSSNDRIYRTSISLKNSARCSLTHDEQGHAVESTLYVRAAALLPSDQGKVLDGTVALTTTSRFNAQGELIHRTFPADNAIEWTYDVDNPDVRSRGNLLEVVQLPAGESTSPIALHSRYWYEQAYQQPVAVTTPRGHTMTYTYDGRGNLTARQYPSLTVNAISRRGTEHKQLTDRFEYNEAGQLIRFTDPRGHSIYYHYEVLPGGADRHGGGFLRRVVRECGGPGDGTAADTDTVSTEFRHDARGNIVGILDGKGNPTRLSYDSHDRLVRVVSRHPFNYDVAFSHDANGNVVEAVQQVDRFHYDSGRQRLERRDSTVRHRFEYSALNNVILNVLSAEDRDIVRTVVRDAAENVVREIDPLGHVTEYEYDERNLILVERFAADTGEQAEVHYTYSLNGRPSSRVRPRAPQEVYHYDAWHRYVGYTDANDVSQQHLLDESGNLVRTRVIGSWPTAENADSQVASGIPPVLEATFHYDEIDRLMRVDRRWHGQTGAPLGRSGYDGDEGLVSVLVEYGDNHLPARIWTEPDRVISIDYDAAARVIQADDGSGASVALIYDANSNPIRIVRTVARTNQPALQYVLSQTFDSLDRLTGRSAEGYPAETFAYNSLGRLASYQHQGGGSVFALHDPLGRLAGAVTEVMDNRDTAAGLTQSCVERLEWDDADRLLARVNARGHATRYDYDARDNLIGVAFPDGREKRYTRDSDGNATQIALPDRTLVTLDYDALGRLVARRAEGPDGRAWAESLTRDALGRVVTASKDDTITIRQFDSLSRPLEEVQNGRTVRFGYDSAGNVVYQAYPGGTELQRTYDAAGRLLEVRTSSGEVIARYEYYWGDLVARRENRGAVSTFAYDPVSHRLRSLSHNAGSEAEPVLAHEYRYDVAGNRVQEDTFSTVGRVGQRYYYDSAHRLVRVQYGVGPARGVHDFAEQRDYELSPTGVWTRVTTRAASTGETVSQTVTVNQREAYVSIDGTRYAYDANGNRIEETPSDVDGSAKRLTYDHDHRLVRVDIFSPDGGLGKTIELAYDAFGHQVRRRVTNEGESREYTRVWSGDQLIEEWEDGALVRSFVHGPGVSEPLTMITYGASGDAAEYAYVTNAEGSVTGLLGADGALAEHFDYDALGQPSRRTVNGTGPVAESDLTNPFLYRGFIYDPDTELNIARDEATDPKTGQAVTATPSSAVVKEKPYSPNPKEPTPWTPDPRVGGQSVCPPEPDYPASIGAHAAVAGIVIITGAEVGLGWLGVHSPGAFGVIHLAWEAFWELGHEQGPGGGHSTPGHSQGSAGASGSSSGQSGSSTGQPGAPSSQPSDRPIAGADYGANSKPGSAGGGSGGGSSGSSGGSSGSGSSSPSPTPSTNTGTGPTVTNNGMTVNGQYTPAGSNQPTSTEPPKGEKKGGGSHMPNPVDGTGEGIDKDWWRDMPYANALSIAQALQSPLKYDERHATPYLALKSPGGTDYLQSALTPPAISVDERGEHVSINLKGVRSADGSAVTTSDGWGDKPKTLAQALAAPRIRDAIVSRF